MNLSNIIENYIWLLLLLCKESLQLDKREKNYSGTTGKFKNKVRMKAAKAKKIDMIKEEVEKHVDLVSEPKIK